MEQTQDDSAVGRLPPEQLAQVLQHVPMRARLSRAALVHSSWRAAAVAATTRVEAPFHPALPAWLAVHAARVHVTSISVHSAPLHARGVVALPASLQNLQALSLSRVDWQAASHGGGGGQRTLAALTTLTALSLSGRAVRHLASLSSLSRLQQLSVSGSRSDLWSETHMDPPSDPDEVEEMFAEMFPEAFVPPWGCDVDEKAQMLHDMFPQTRIPRFDRAEAGLVKELPALQSLTRVELEGGIGSAGVVASLSGLQRLQSLTLRDTPTQRFATPLPASLTHLALALKHAGPLTSSGAAGIAQLSGLRELTLNRVHGLDPDVLGGRLASSLQRLALYSVQLAATAGAPQPLLVFTRLTALTELAFTGQCAPQGLPGQPAGAVTAAEAGALAASSQLTRLCVWGLDGNISTLQQAHYGSMFPAAGRQLPRLVEMGASLRLLDNIDVLAQAAGCCPGLTHLQLHGTVVGTSAATETAAAAGGDAPAADGGAPAASGDAAAAATAAAATATAAAKAALAAGIQGLTAFQRLQTLTLCASDALPAAALSAMAGLSTLRRLDVQNIHRFGLEPDHSDALCLTRLTRLTFLHLNAQTELDTPFPDFAADVQLHSKAPPDSPPDVWWQLPCALLTAAEMVMWSRCERCQYDDLWEVESAMARLGGVVARQHRQQERELQDARAQVRQLQQELRAAQQQQQQQ